MSIELVPALPLWLIIAVAVGLLAVLAYGCLVLMRKRVPTRWVGILAALRVVIVTVFVLCLLQPVVSTARSIMKRPALLVMFDTSGSMAGAAGLSGQSNASSDAPAAPSDASSADNATAAPRLAPAMAEHLREHFELRAFTFDRDAQPVAVDELGEKSASGETTRIGTSLQTAATLARYSRDGSGDSAAGEVLLISDGHDHGQQDVVRAARQLGVTVNVLAPAKQDDAGASDDVKVTSVQAPARVLIGSEMTFDVMLSRAGAERARDVTVTLREDGEVVRRQTTRFASGQRHHRLNVRHRPDEPGLREYAFTARPGQSNAASKANEQPASDDDRFSVSVDVLKRKHEVLMLEQTWRWEFKFLRRILEHDPSFNFTAFLARGAQSYMQFGEPGRKVDLGGFPQGRGELAWFDVFVIGDVAPQRWPDGFAGALNELVVERGRSLVILAGPGTNRLAQQPAMRQLLPVELGSAWRPVGGPVALQLTRDGLGSSIFTRPNAPTLWRELPPMEQIYPPLRKKPGASVLAEATDHRNEFGPLIAMAEHTVGRGRVLYVGTDTLWQWQTKGPKTERDVTPYEVFWQQALRALAPARPSPGAADLTLRPARSRYHAGRTVTVSATLRSNQSLNDPQLEATITRPDGGESPLVLLPDADASRAYAAEFEADQPGTYTLTARAMQQGQPLTSTQRAIHVAPAPREADDRGVNHALLQRLARSTGGRVVDPADRDTWPRTSEANQRSVTQRETTDLWHNYALMLVLVTLFGVDWLLRLVRGYV